MESFYKAPKGISKRERKRFRKLAKEHKEFKQSLETMFKTFDFAKMSEIISFLGLLRVIKTGDYEERCSATRILEAIKIGLVWEILDQVSAAEKKLTISKKIEKDMALLSPDQSSAILLDEYRKSSDWKSRKKMNEILRTPYFFGGLTLENVTTLN